MKFNRLSILVLIMACLCFEVTTAQDLSAFKKRFQIIRDENGKLVSIKDLSMETKFSIAPYFLFFKNALIHQQKKSTTFHSELATLMDDSNFTNENQEEMDQALVELKKLPIDKIFKDAGFIEVGNTFEGKMQNALDQLDPTIIARPYDPTFYYKRNVVFKAVKMALDFAKSRLSSIPVLNTISYAIVQISDMITSRREFHQNMLLHYLENIPAEKLGLTHDEVNLIWSSIYEARIPWFRYDESKNAKASWDHYGVDHFYGQFRQGSAVLYKNESRYTELLGRLNFAFEKVQTKKNETIVINLMDNAFQFSSKPAVAYSYTSPAKIAQLRTLLMIGELGLSFLSISDSIKDKVGSFMKSFYQNQSITEGALMGHFESTNDREGAMAMKVQHVNPFDIL